MPGWKFFWGALAFLFYACGGGSGGTPDAGQDGDGTDGADQDILCQTIGDCPGRHLCLGGVCRPGTVCTSNDQCPAGYLCMILKEVCVPENPCTGDGDCAAPTPYCLTSSGICVACREDAHCGQGMVCNEQFRCAPAGPDCTNDTDCADTPALPHCDTAQGKCFACVSDAHCGLKYCEPTLRQCVECYQAGHCAPPRPYCLTGQHLCVACRDNNDCTGGLRCSAAHECTAVTCQSDADCSALVNTPHCDAQSGDCVECTLNSHCGTNAWCRNFLCQSGCLSDAECIEKLGQGYHCNMATGTCYLSECLDNDDCNGVAGKPYCKVVAGSPQLNKCVECLQDGHCREFYYCKPENVCAPTPCSRYPDPEAKCREVNPCYICDYVSGQCKPPTNQAGFQCTWPAGPECCPGYICTTSGKCQFDINCSAQDPVCAEGYTCNTNTNQCEWISPCGTCPSGQICNSQTGQCEVGLCHEAGDECDPFKQNCCAPLRCNPFWPFCTGG